MSKIFGTIVLITIAIVVSGEKILENLVEPIDGTSGLYFDFIADTKFYKENDEYKIVSFFDMERYMRDTKNLINLIDTIESSNTPSIYNSYHLLLLTLSKFGVENNRITDEFLVDLYNNDTHLSDFKKIEFEQLSESSMRKYVKNIKDIQSNPTVSANDHRNGVYYNNDNFEYIFEKNSTDYEELKKSLTESFLNTPRADRSFESEFFMFPPEHEYNFGVLYQIESQITDLFSTWTETQKTLHNILETPNYVFIQPEKIREINSIIKKDLSNNVSIADGHNRLSIGISKPYILFETRIPLVSNKNYKLYKVYPLPIPQPDGYSFIQPSMEYLAVDSEQEFWTELDALHMDLCFKSDIYGKVCKFENDKRAIETLPSKRKCEMNLLIDTNHNANTQCNMTKHKFRSFWTQVNKENKWIFSTNNPLPIQIVCRNSGQNFTIKDRGILTIKDGCFMKSKDVKIVSQNFRKDGPQFIAMNSSVFHYRDFSDYNLLKLAVGFHHKNERLHNEHNVKLMNEHTHNKVSYYLIFTLFLILIGVGVYLVQINLNMRRFRITS